MQEIQTVGNYIVFQFVEKTIGGRFVNSHHGGIAISVQDTYQTNLPRWGVAVNVGPECTDVKPGDYIMIEGGKWTTGFIINDQKYWKTDESVVMAISDEPGTTF